MDFLEQPRWITSSGNAIDIGDTGPTGGLVMGQGEGIAPTWLVPTEEGQTLKSLGPTYSGGPAQIGWDLPPIRQINGQGNNGLSIYAPTTGSENYSGREVLTSSGCSTGTPFWQDPLITRLNGQWWGPTINDFSIYAPTDAGTAGHLLVSSGSGAPVWENGGNRVYYGYCSTSDTTNSKTITLYNADYVPPETGTILMVDFTYGSRPDTNNSSWETNYGSITLSVPTSSSGSRTSKTVYYRGNAINRYKYSFGWDNNQVVTFVYNNSGYWEMVAGGSGYIDRGEFTSSASKTKLPANSQYDRIVILHGVETQSYGTIAAYVGVGTSNKSYVGVVSGSHSNWGAAELSLTVFCPGGYDIYTETPNLGTMYYTTFYLFT